jgi:hypothetical protein
MPALHLGDDVLGADVVAARDMSASLSRKPPDELVLDPL